MIFTINITSNTLITSSAFISAYSLKKKSDVLEKLSRNVSKKNQDEICEFLCMLGGIISGHIEYSEKLSPDLEALNKKWASSMNKIPKSEMEDLK